MRALASLAQACADWQPSSYDEAAMTAPQDFFGGQKIFELFGGLTKSIPAVSYTADNSKASDIMTTAQSEILSGGKDLVATLQDAAKQIANATGRTIAP